MSSSEQTILVPHSILTKESPQKVGTVSPGGDTTGTLSHQAENPGLSEAELNTYVHDAEKAMMWLSSQMKIWLRENYIYPKEDSDSQNIELDPAALLELVKERVVSVSPLPQARKLSEALTTFVDTLRLQVAEPGKQDDQASIIKKWQKAQAAILASPDSISFAAYQALSNSDLIDGDEFKSLATEFKHDINTAGLSLLAAEMNKHLVIPETKAVVPKTIFWQSVRNAFDTPNQFMIGGKHSAEKILDKLESPDRQLVLDPDLMASIVIKIHEVLNSFNLESGSVAYEPVAAAVAVDYIQSEVTAAKSKYPFEIVFQPMIDQTARTSQTYLNKAALVRFLVNSFSNIQRVGATKVVVQCSLTQDTMTVAINDNGKGFPNVTNEPGTVLDNTLKLYEVQQGKTSWENTTGTGTGLAGIKNLMTKIGGRLITGNRIVNGQTVGSTVAVIAGVKSPELNIEAVTPSP